MSEPISVIGVGGLAKAVISALRAAGHEVSRVYDDDPSALNGEVLGVPVVGPLKEAAQGPAQSVIALAGTRARRDAAEALELEWLTVVHPHSWVAPTASLGPGAIVLAGAVVESDARLGCHTVVEPAATIGPDGQLDDWSHVERGAQLCAAVWIGEGARVGAGSVVEPGRRVGSWSEIAAGSVVAQNVEGGGSSPPAASSSGDRADTNAPTYG
jgi:sugar O-acyltransferase (sialic acid O-acetyltransferase NeuD family)